MASKRNLMFNILLKIVLYILLSVFILVPTVSTSSLLYLLVLLAAILAIYSIKLQSIKYLILIGYCLISLYIPELAFGIFLLPFSTLSPFMLLPMILVVVVTTSTHEMLVYVGLLLLVYFAERVYLQMQSLRHTTRILEDKLESFTKHAETEHGQLLESQRHELEVSVLNERNRIARDIHDNVGHLLTRAILQVGALSAQNPSPELKNIKETLDHGMNAIRSSVHSLYDTSIRLEHEIEDMIASYPHLYFTFAYNITTDPPTVIKTAFSHIIKEALTNTAKHSNATDVTIQIDESNHHYYCLVSDNGTNSKTKTSSGIGLMSIEKRIRDAQGIINIQTENGYRIYTSIPKETL